MHLEIFGKTVKLHFGALMAEKLYLDVINGKVSEVQSDWTPKAIYYAHLNHCKGWDCEPVVSQGEVFRWHETASNEVIGEVMTAYENSIAKERWDKITDDVKKKIAEITTTGETISGTSLEYSNTDLPNIID